MRRLIALVALAACASPAPPPGGPEDRAAPQLVSVSPDSGSVGAAPRAVVFRFDEVVNERPQGAADLSQMFLISPRDGAPRVDWDRKAIAIRPRERWRPNTVYAVTMLPGIADLRGNVRREPTKVIFSTGAVIPNTAIRGTLFDWTTGRPAARGAVEAVAQWDSTMYVSQADSVGNFELAHVPAGVYVVRGYVDGNNNRALDLREAWDSVRVELADTARIELLSFVRDSLGPRISSISMRDSATLHVRFDRPIDPAQALDASLFTLKSADSATVPIARVQSARDFDRGRDTLVPGDTARDTLAARTPLRAPARPPGPALPRPTRPIPVSDVIVQTAAPLDSGRSYRLEARGVRSLEGIARTSDRVFDAGPTPPPLPPGAPAAPGAPGAPRTPGARPDSAIRRPP